MTRQTYDLLCNRPKLGLKKTGRFYNWTYCQPSPREHFIWLKSLWPSDDIWRYTSGSTLAQVMAPSHYLNQYWLLISEVLWHSPVSASAQATIMYHEFENYTFIITGTYPRGQWVKSSEIKARFLSIISHRLISIMQPFKWRQQMHYECFLVVYRFMLFRVVHIMFHAKNNLTHIHM